MHCSGYRRRGRIPILILLAAALPALAQEPTPTPDTAKLPPTVREQFDTLFDEFIVAPLEAVLFFGLPTGTDQDLPLIIAVLVSGGIFFTVRYGFINIRLFRHSFDVIRGKFDSPHDEGEISHFKALTSALSATVGLGNIAGVAVAISVGGPGAVFWMWITAVFGMSMKFSSCTLAQLYREVKPDGHVLGGPMVYLHHGIRERFPALAPIGKALSVIFCVLAISASMGGGNMFQGNQTSRVIEFGFFGLNAPQWVPVSVGLVMAVSVGLVIIGGIRRIGEVTSRLVPTMCIFYCLMCLTIVVLHAGLVPAMIRDILTQAFSLEAGIGGMLAVLITGMQRAAFSNEAGIGSAAIAHAAARTKEPAREGVVAMIGPFIDTIIVCSFTAFAILITEAHLNPEIVDAEMKGVQLTALALQDLGGIAPLFLSLAVAIFAYSTMISWGYYGERATEYLFGTPGILPYRIVFVIAVFLGPLLSLKNVIAFSDLMLLSMAFPNIFGMIFLSSKVRKLSRDYTQRLRSGAMKPVR